MQAVQAEHREEIDELDAINAVLTQYMEGSAKGDASMLREVFHPDSRMFGSVGGHRFDIAIEPFFELAAKAPADVKGSYRGRIVSVSQVGDAAIATVAEDGFWGRVSFVDFFSLAKIDSRWRIVNKTFAHTGGEPPAM